MTADVHEVEELAQDLMAAVVKVQTKAMGIVRKGAVNIKKDWRQNATVSAGRHAPRYPFSIDFDMAPSVGAIIAEIGPDKDKTQGALGNLIEFGSVHNPPHNDGGRALDKEEPNFIAWAAKLGVAEVLGKEVL